MCSSLTVRVVDRHCLGCTALDRGGLNIGVGAGLEPLAGVEVGDLAHESAMRTQVGWPSIDFPGSRCIDARRTTCSDPHNCTQIQYPMDYDT